MQESWNQNAVPKGHLADGCPPDVEMEAFGGPANYEEWPSHNRALSTSTTSIESFIMGCSTVNTAISRKPHSGAVNRRPKFKKPKSRAFAGDGSTHMVNIICQLSPKAVAKHWLCVEVRLFREPS